MSAPTIHPTTDTGGVGADGHQIGVGWLAGWALLTTFAVFEVVKHGYVNGGAGSAALLTAAAIVGFIAPDLTFLVGIGQETQPGKLPRRAVPFYNAMHRFLVPFVLTTVIGVALAPLGLGALVAFIWGLSWMAHIAADRAVGYGLRNADGSR
ncbi:MAG: DUF4260 family protein [Planctomycetota bacterium]|jgi:hypothetical protein